MIFFYVTIAILVMLSIGFGFAIGCLWTKEKYAYWTEDEINEQLNN